MVGSPLILAPWQLDMQDFLPVLRHQFQMYRDHLKGYAYVMACDDDIRIGVSKYKVLESKHVADRRTRPVLNIFVLACPPMLAHECAHGRVHMSVSKRHKGTRSPYGS